MRAPDRYDRVVASRDGAASATSASAPVASTARPCGMIACGVSARSSSLPRGRMRLAPGRSGLFPPLAECLDRQSARRRSRPPSVRTSVGSPELHRKVIRDVVVVPVVLPQRVERFCAFSTLRCRSGPVGPLRGSARLCCEMCAVAVFRVPVCVPERARVERQRGEEFMTRQLAIGGSPVKAESAWQCVPSAGNSSNSSSWFMAASQSLWAGG